MKRTWTTKLKAATGGFLATGALFVILGTAMTLPSPASAVSMTDYTWMPVFVGQNVPPNILFIVDIIYQALVGGAPKPAQANADGSADSMAGQDKTGENGSPSSNCSDNSKSCWRYVKFVPTATLVGRVPTFLPADFAGGMAGRYF